MKSPSLNSAKERGFQALWLSVLVLSVVYLAFCWRGRESIETDLLKLLPAGERPESVNLAKARFLKEVSNRLFFFIETENKERSFEAAASFADKLISSGFFREVAAKEELDRERELFKLYFKYKEKLYSEELRSHFLKSDAQYIINRSSEIINSPVIPRLGFFILNDPFFLFFDLVRLLPKPPGNYQVQQGFLTTKLGSKLQVIIQTKLLDTVFNREYQRNLSSFLKGEKQRLKEKFPEIIIREAGALPYAEAAADSSERDLKLVGAGSSIIVAGLFLLVYKSAWLLGVVLITVFLSTLFSISLVLYLFGSVHIITLAFGASLIGVSSDYSYHYFSQALGRSGISAEEITNELKEPLYLAMLTSVLAFAGLLLVPFPGLNQMALFSVAGLLASYLNVRFLYRWIPAGVLSKLSKADSRPKEWAFQFFSFVYKTAAFLPKKGLVLLLLLIAISGFALLKTDDNVRSLQARPDELIKNEMPVKEALGKPDQGRFFVLTAGDKQGLLEKEYGFIKKLKELKGRDLLKGFYATSMFVPPLKDQVEAFEAFKSFVNGSRQKLSQAFEDFGLERGVFEAYLEDSIKNEMFFEPKEWMRSPIFKELEFLWQGDSDSESGDFTSLVILNGVSNPEELSSVEERARGIYFIDLSGEASQALKHYRVTAAAWVSLFYLLVYLLLTWHYGFKDGLRAMVPAILGLILNLAVHGIFGLEINLFSTLAMMIVLGLSIDYSIFLLEEKTHRKETMLLIWLSAVSTICSFGFLGLSTTPLLSSFGLAVFLGIVFSLLLCPLLSRRGV